ncbi:hypothetical protein BJ085DRAFT_40964 [Dimargaris cristalligena]|uniref:DH domain-containing protein n=1 Tax=Dimargaris cristalligena TaxID=215637 RepID=A0A4P9ZVW7_9FUNG|nr:hypothetical protein BJ085DRAFT_40964 [Dimargaris cristalligena]|eukprot:RKP37091.1 hypothetical protein BJ085DRAFT_40964 [Dimargaris cristalligena]
MPRMLWRDCLTQKEFEAYAFTPKDIERQEIMFEIIHTEADYVRDLILVREVFVKPLRHLQVIPEACIDRLFANLEAILPIHECIKKDFLNRQQEQYPVLHGLADVLLPWVHELHIYSDYLCNQAESLRLMAELIQTNEKFEHFYKDRHHKPECRGLGLDAFLILPFQRLLKYPLFLKNLLGATPEDHPDYKMTQGVIMQFEALITKIQQEKQQADRIDSLRFMESCVKGLEEYTLVHPHRRIMREGTLFRVKAQIMPRSRNDPHGAVDIRVAPHHLSPVYIILFNDMLLVTRLRSRRSSGLAMASLVKGASLNSNETTPTESDPSSARGSASLPSGTSGSSPPAPPPPSILANYSAGKTSPPKYALVCPPATLVSVHNVEDDSESGLVHAFRCYVACHDKTEMFVLRCNSRDDKIEWIRAFNATLNDHLTARAHALGDSPNGGNLLNQLQRWSLADPPASPSDNRQDERAVASSATGSGPASKSRPLSIASGIMAAPRWLDLSRINRSSGVNNHNATSDSLTPTASPGSPIPSPSFILQAPSPPLPSSASITPPILAGPPIPQVGRPRAASCVGLGSSAPHSSLFANGGGGSGLLPSSPLAPSTPGIGSGGNALLLSNGGHYRSGIRPATVVGGTGSYFSPTAPPVRGDKKSTKASQFLLSSVKKLRLPTADAYAMRKFRKQLQDYGREDRPQSASGNGKKSIESPRRPAGSEPRSADAVLPSRNIHRSTSQLLNQQGVEGHPVIRPEDVQVRYRRSQSIIEGGLGYLPALSPSLASPAEEPQNFGPCPPRPRNHDQFHHRRFPSCDQALFPFPSIPLDPFVNESVLDTETWLHSQAALESVPKPSQPTNPHSPPLLSSAIAPPASTTHTSTVPSGHSSQLHPPIIYPLRTQSLKPSLRVHSNPLPRMGEVASVTRPSSASITPSTSGTSSLASSPAIQAKVPVQFQPLQRGQLPIVRLDRLPEAPSECDLYSSSPEDGGPAMACLPAGLVALRSSTTSSAAGDDQRRPRDSACAVNSSDPSVDSSTSSPTLATTTPTVQLSPTNLLYFAAAGGRASPPLSEPRSFLESSLIRPASQHSLASTATRTSTSPSVPSASNNSINSGAVTAGIANYSYLHKASSYLSRPSGLSKPLPIPPRTASTSPSTSASFLPGFSPIEAALMGPCMAVSPKPVYHPAQRVARTMKDYYGNIVSIPAPGGDSASPTMTAATPMLGKTAVRE